MTGKRLRLLAAKAVAKALAAVRLLLSPVTIGFSLILFGCGAIARGVFELYGLGPALIAGGALALLAGILLLRGVSHVE